MKQEQLQLRRVNQISVIYQQSVMGLQNQGIEILINFSEINQYFREIVMVIVKSNSS